MTKFELKPCRLLWRPFPPLDVKYTRRGHQIHQNTRVFRLGANTIKYTAKYTEVTLLTSGAAAWLFSKFYSKFACAHSARKFPGNLPNFKKICLNFGTSSTSPIVTLPQQAGQYDRSLRTFTAHHKHAAQAFHQGIQQTASCSSWQSNRGCWLPRLCICIASACPEIVGADERAKLYVRYLEDSGPVYLLPGGIR